MALPTTVLSYLRTERMALLDQVKLMDQGDLRIHERREYNEIVDTTADSIQSYKRKVRKLDSILARYSADR